jgi:hypothetical protein
MNLPKKLPTFPAPFTPAHPTLPRKVLLFVFSPMFYGSVLGILASRSDAPFVRTLRFQRTKKQKQKNPVPSDFKIKGIYSLT